MSYNNYNTNPHYQENGGGHAAHQHQHQQQFYSPTPVNNNPNMRHHANMNVMNTNGNPMMMPAGSNGGYPNQQPPGGYHHQPQQPYPFQPNNLFGDPVVSSLAMKYGTNLADQGKEYVSKNVRNFFFEILKIIHYLFTFLNLF